MNPCAPPNSTARLSPRRRRFEPPSTVHHGARRDQPLPPPVKRKPEVVLPDPLFAIASKVVPESATEYLAGRGFDVMELWVRWRVCYCPTWTWSYNKVEHARIVMPLQLHGLPPRLAGWTARQIGDKSICVLDDQGKAQKYVNMRGMLKSALLYGWPAMQETGPIVICEGATDVWRLGCNALALLGKSASTFQEGMKLRAAKGRPIVVFLDADANPEALRLRDHLRRLRQQADDRKPVMLAKLPEGKNDIGELTRNQAWECVAEALKQTVADLGVEVDRDMHPEHPFMPSIRKPRIKLPR